MSSPEQILLASLTHLMARWSSAGTQAAVAADAGVQVDPVDLPPLYMLGLEGPSRASDLAAALRISRPTATKQLNRLASAGYIERVPDPADRRASIVRLSPRGIEVHARLVDQGVVMVSAALTGWSSAESAAFAAQLARFVSALGASDPEREPAPGPARSATGSQNGE
ncbi:MarR family winged helix-turn-helix transcriptional regulator [Microbacterium sp. NPDC057659]|uniref:MarR family winged helix-turn-helix transcriptional regulator n=1 Tax=Microbacterium sp. NPDC057659 TaxID=3346198 RepID=UPI00366CBC3B